jgi:hypothetical protein
MKATSSLKEFPAKYRSTIVFQPAKPGSSSGNQLISSFAVAV